MQSKYFDIPGEIAFRLWMFENAVSVLQANPNAEKAANLKRKMQAFSATIAEKGTEENMLDIKALIKEL